MLKHQTIQNVQNFSNVSHGLGLGLNPRPRIRLFLQGQDQGQDLAIRDQGQCQDLKTVSSRIIEAKARPRGQQDWFIYMWYRLTHPKQQKMER